MEPPGNLAVVGYTSSDNFPTTQGAFDKILNGAYDSFVTSFHFPPVKVEPVDITLDEVSSSQLYARYRPYDFSVDVIDIVPVYWVA